MLPPKKSTSTRRKNSSKRPSGSPKSPAEKPVVKPCSRAFARCSSLDDLLGLPLLSREQEKTAHPEQLYAHNTRLAMAMVKQRATNPGDMPLWVNSALIGLWKAAHQFDPSKLVHGRFSNYACHHIRREFQLLRRSLRSGVTMPIAAERDRAAHLAGKTETRDRVRRRLELAPVVTSLDDIPVDLAGHDSSPDPAVVAARASLASEVLAVFATLPKQQQVILRHRLVLGNADEKTLAQLGKRFGVTRERIRQIEFAALRTLRRRAAAAGLSAESLKIFEK